MPWRSGRVSFGGVRTLQLFDLDTVSMSFGVFEFSAITIGSYYNGRVILI